MKVFNLHFNNLSNHQGRHKENAMVSMNYRIPSTIRWLGVITLDLRTLKRTLEKKILNNYLC